MATYETEHRIDFTPEQEREFRAQLDRWCRTEEAYEGPLFGQQAKILEVSRSTVYAATLRQQFDKRVLKRDASPAQELFSPRITEFRQVDAWARAALPAAFEERQERIIVDESKETRTCDKCGGRGKPTCPECKGVGTVMKERTVKLPCSRCNEKGTITTTSTNSYWQGTNGVRYTNGGEGRTFRTETVTHTHTCSACRGEGHTEKTERYRGTCDRCGGSGKLICPACQGSGLMMHFICIDRELYQQTRTRYIAPAMLDADETRELYACIGPEDWRQVEQFRIERTAFDDCPAGSRPVVGAMIRRLFQGAGDSAESKSCFSTLTTYGCDIVAVRYAYGGREYRCALLGDKRKLFAVVSPISDYADGLRAEAVASVRKKDVSSSWKALRRIVRFSQSSETDKTALEEVERRMALTAHYGKLGGAMLGIVLLFPILIDIFTHCNIVAPWTQLAYYLYSPADDAPFRAALGLGFAFWLVKDTWLFRTPRWVYLRGSGFGRVLGGTVWGLAAMAVSVVFILLLNYSGLLHLAMLLLLLLLGAVGAIVMAILILITLIFR